MARPTKNILESEAYTSIITLLAYDALYAESKKLKYLPEELVECTGKTQRELLGEIIKFKPISQPALSQLIRNLKLKGYVRGDGETRRFNKKQIFLNPDRVLSDFANVLVENYKRTCREKLEEYDFLRHTLKHDDFIKDLMERMRNVDGVDFRNLSKVEILKLISHLLVDKELNFSDEKSIVSLFEIKFKVEYCLAFERILEFQELNDPARLKQIIRENHYVRCLILDSLGFASVNRPFFWTKNLRFLFENLIDWLVIGRTVKEHVKLFKEHARTGKLYAEELDFCYFVGFLYKLSDIGRDKHAVSHFSSNMISYIRAVNESLEIK